MLRAVAMIGLLGFGYLFLSGRIARAADAGGAGGGAPTPKPQAVALPHGQIVALADSISRLTFGGAFDLAEILAVIEIESGFNPRAYRAEPQLGDASRGLMQLLLSTARDRGYRGVPDGLYDPATNIRFGIAHLQWGRDYLRSRLGRAPSVSEWVGAYNAGVGNALKGYVPLGYVNRWLAARDRWRARLAGRPA